MREETLSEVTVTKSLAMNWEKTGAVIGISGKYIGMILRIRPNQKIYIGRDYHVVDIVLEEENISRCHCWIAYDDEREQYLFWDCSKNGVTLNDQCRVEREKLLFLSAGDELRMASTKNVFKLG